MGEVNWDLAPEGAVGLAASREDSEVIWVREDKGEDYNGWSLSEWDTTVSDDYVTIATRPSEQAKTVADEQEGEKWTHTWKGDKCRIVFTEGESSWINGHFLNTIVHNSSLKPIKPKLTKSEYELLARMASFFYVRDSEFNDYISGFEII